MSSSERLGPTVKRSPEEMSERFFTTEPKTRRHLYGLTATRKRAALLMELLFQKGFVRENPYGIVKEFVEKNAWFIGMDPQERTIIGYIGRPATQLTPDQLPKTHVTITYETTRTQVPKTYSAWRELREKLGVCHKLGWMKFEYRVKNWEYDEHDVLRKLRIPIVTTFVIFNHKEVPLPYHLQQKPLFNSEKSEAVAPEIGRMGTSKSEVCVEASKDDLCVSPICRAAVNREVSMESILRDKRERRVSKQHTQIRSNPESESNRTHSGFLEGDGLSPTQRATIEERDRKRLQILDENLLPQLEKSVKKQI